VITLASHLSTFLREYLPKDRAASTHTCETYAYSLMLLLRFAAEHLSVTPSRIDLAQVDATLVLGFLTHIEKGRGKNPQCSPGGNQVVLSLSRIS
jgi:integrase/recombinase XerD